MTNESWEKVQSLIHSENFGVLGTTMQGHAYASLVAFSASQDGRELYFATTRATRKYHNISQDQHVSFLIDNRSDESLPLYDAIAVTAYGCAEEVLDPCREKIKENYLIKHPYLKSFTKSPTTALFRVNVLQYHLVERFQHVTEFGMEA